MMIIRTKTVFLLMAVMCSSLAFAKLTPEEAARLGDDLTPIGAEKAGNAEGTIPPFSGKLPEFPEEVYSKPGAHLPNPYGDEEPLFVITADNVAEHADKLTEGQQAMFEKYPETFKMKIYPSHRDALFDDWVYRHSIENATRAELADGGNGVINAYAGPPFPIPKTGQEAVWNHLVHASHYYTKTRYDAAAVYNNGSIAWEGYRVETLAPYQDENGSIETFNDMLGYQFREILDPPQKKGELILVQEPLDQVAEPRKAWNYLPGTRRVRRAPVVAYDSPTGPGKLITTDDGRMFNGAIDRYDWNLLGKKEIYIPYNNYDMDSPDLSYKELLQVNHVNPEPMRYELHRVWVVEATLKEGKRHVYGKRVLYIDEDSWNSVIMDNYDTRGNIWRTAMQTSVIHPLMAGLYGRLWIYNDLQADAYVIDRLVNEQPQAERFDQEAVSPEYFTPANLRRITRR